MQSACMPRARRSSAIPSGRLMGPEKRMRARRGDEDVPGVSPESRTAAGRPGGCVPSSALRAATGGASRCGGDEWGWSRGRQGNRVSSKYTSEVVTMFLEVGIQMLYEPGMLEVRQR
eukprot:1233618-Pleurochrysis_carterae.AAC.1